MITNVACLCPVITLATGTRFHLFCGEVTQIGPRGPKVLAARPRSHQRRRPTGKINHVSIYWLLISLCLSSLSRSASLTSHYVDNLRARGAKRAALQLESRLEDHRGVFVLQSVTEEVPVPGSNKVATVWNQLC